MAQNVPKPGTSPRSKSRAVRLVWVLWVMPGLQCLGLGAAMWQ